MGRSRLVRAPNEFIQVLGNIQEAEGIQHKTDCMRKIAQYAVIGREVATKDLLRANTLWFDIRNKGRKK